MFYTFNWKGLLYRINLKYVVEIKIGEKTAQVSFVNRPEAFNFNESEFKDNKSWVDFLETLKTIKGT